MSRVLFSYWRSSASYRVRIALALKGLEYETRTVDLRSGAHRSDEFREVNPQGLVPFYRDDLVSLGQSLAIIEYLDETHPTPRLLPADPGRRARARAAAQLIASDIHPLGNLRVLRYLKTELGHAQATIDRWGRGWIEDGFAALESLAEAGPYVLGNRITLADICLVPQMYNARRIGVDLTPFPKLVAIDQALREEEPVRQARPEAQPDADPL
jgi:maleylacetoacetate isomerase/maleylpyruvate isomerase